MVRKCVTRHEWKCGKSKCRLTRHGNLHQRAQVIVESYANANQQQILSAKQKVSSFTQQRSKQNIMNKEILNIMTYREILKKSFQLLWFQIYASSYVRSLLSFIIKTYQQKSVKRSHSSFLLIIIRRKKGPAEGKQNVGIP